MASPLASQYNTSKDEEEAYCNVKKEDSIKPVIRYPSRGVSHGGFRSEKLILFVDIGVVVYASIFE